MYAALGNINKQRKSLRIRGAFVLLWAARENKQRAESTFAFCPAARARDEVHRWENYYYARTRERESEFCFIMRCVLWRLIPWKGALCA